MFFKPKEVIKEVVVKIPPTATDVVKTITDDKFEWFDYNELPEGERLKYYQQAQLILNSPIFQNEISRLNAEWAQWAAKEAKNFEGVSAMRYQMSGINLLRERLESVEDPTVKNKPADEPFAGL